MSYMDCCGSELPTHSRSLSLSSIQTRSFSDRHKGRSCAARGAPCASAAVPSLGRWRSSSPARPPRSQRAIGRDGARVHARAGERESVGRLCINPGRSRSLTNRRVSNSFNSCGVGASFHDLSICSKPIETAPQAWSVGAAFLECDDKDCSHDLVTGCFILLHFFLAKTRVRSPPPRHLRPYQSNWIQELFGGRSGEPGT